MPRPGTRSTSCPSTPASGLQDLADEAFRDFLKKHGRPITLRDALLESVRLHPANDGAPNQRTRHG
jgi:hypothetical protein